MADITLNSRARGRQQAEEIARLTVFGEQGFRFGRLPRKCFARQCLCRKSGIAVGPDDNKLFENLKLRQIFSAVAARARHGFAAARPEEREAGNGISA